MSAPRVASRRKQAAQFGCASVFTRASTGADAILDVAAALLSDESRATGVSPLRGRFAGRDEPDSSLSRGRTMGWGLRAAFVEVAPPPLPTLSGAAVVVCVCHSHTVTAAQSHSHSHTATHTRDAWKMSATSGGRVVTHVIRTTATSPQDLFTLSFSSSSLMRFNSRISCFFCTRYASRSFSHDCHRRHPVMDTHSAPHAAAV